MSSPCGCHPCCTPHPITAAQGSAPARARTASHTKHTHTHAHKQSHLNQEDIDGFVQRAEDFCGGCACVRPHLRQHLLPLRVNKGVPLILSWHTQPPPPKVTARPNASTVSLTSPTRVYCLPKSCQASAVCPKTKGTSQQGDSVWVLGLPVAAGTGHRGPPRRHAGARRASAQRSRRTLQHAAAHRRAAVRRTRSHGPVGDVARHGLVSDDLPGCVVHHRLQLSAFPRVRGSESSLLMRLPKFAHFAVVVAGLASLSGGRARADLARAPPAWSR